MKIKNISASTVNLNELPGRFLMPDDTGQQRMMIAEPIFVSLKPGQELKRKVNAFCTESHDAAPNQETSFSFGNMATGNLLSMCKFISEKKYYGSEAQNAVWCMSNGNNPDYISSYDDTAIANSLRKFACSLLNVPFKKNITPDAGYTPSPLLRYVDGTIEYTIQRPHNITLKVYNQDGQLVKELVNNVQQDAGEYKYVYHLTVPLNDPNHPHQWITVKYWMDGKLLHEQKHVLTD